MEVYFSVINSILLIILFFYQRNRNKVLEDHLSQQNKLIDETKSVVTQQSAAIEGQGKVVDTALKYSESFDVKKIESIIRRELEIDHKVKIDQLEKELESLLSKAELKTSQNFKLNIEKIIKSASSVASDLTLDFVLPLIPYVIDALITLPKIERLKALESIPEPLRSNLAESIKKIEITAPEILKP